MRIIITGSNGFIGRNLIKIFSNNEILAISPHNDIKFSNYLAASNTTLFLIKDNLIDFQPNIIIINGWDGGQGYKYTNSTNQLTQNAYPIIKFLDTIKNKLNNVLIIGIGSAAEYGFFNFPITEDSKENPVSLYGLSKLYLKEYLNFLYKTMGIKYLWIRPCTLYGYGDIKTRLIPRVISSCLKDEEIELNDCLTWMDYLHIEDFCFCIKELINRKECGIFNLGSGESILVRDMVLKIQKKIGLGKIIFNSKLNRINFPNYICSSVSKLWSILGKDFYKYNLDTGIEEIIKNYEFIRK